MYLTKLLSQTFIVPPTDETGSGTGEGGTTETVEPVQLQLSDHSTYARNKLAHLQERLTNKLLVSACSKEFPLSLPLNTNIVYQLGDKKSCSIIK